MSTVLTRDDILNFDDRIIEPVEVPEWGGKTVFIRGLSGADRDDFEFEMIVQRQTKQGKRPTQELNLKNMRAKLIVRCAVDSDDVKTAKTIFTLADIDKLGTKNAAALQRLNLVARRLSGLSDDDVEELTEELGEGQSDGSGSDSQDTLGSPSRLHSVPSLPESSANGSPTTDSTPLGAEA